MCGTLELSVPRLVLRSKYSAIILFVLNCCLKQCQQNQLNGRSFGKHLHYKYVSIRSDLFSKHCKFEAIGQRFSTIECHDVTTDSLTNKLLSAMTGHLRRQLATQGDVEVGKLVISNSSLTRIDQTFVDGIKFQFISIKKTNLMEINLDVFSQSFATLKRLEIIHNDLREFPLTGRQMPTQVTHLDLFYNSLTTIPDYGFALMPRLKTIDLSFNQISYVGSNAFYLNDKLEYLDLKYNKIKVLNNRALALRQYNPRLSIDLSHNKLFYLADEALDRQSPFLLNLSENQLTSLPEKHFWPLIKAMEDLNIGIIDVKSQFPK